MRISFPKERLLPAALAAGMLALGSCTNNDYDLDEVDMTMGFGGDELVIPSSSTDIIKLSDVLDLEEDGSVVLDADSNYVFQLAETGVDPAKPYVDVVRLTPKSYAIDYVFEPSSGAKPHAMTRAGGTTVRVPEKKVMEFEFNGNSPEVKSLTSASTNDIKIVLSMNFASGMASCMPTISKITLTVPGYFNMESVRLVSGSGKVSSVSNGCVTLTDIPTASPLKLELTANGLDFTNYDTKYGGLTIDNGAIRITGDMYMSMEAELVGVPSASSFTISSTMTIDEMAVTGAKGKFDPEIDLTDLGEVSVSGVPDFLSDGNVCIDLYNPQIRLKVANDMEVAAKVKGKVVAIKDGRTIATVSLDEMDIHNKSYNADGTTRICICRSVPATKEAGWDYYAVPTLSSIIHTIPDVIKITDTEVRADQSKDAEFKFGTHYTVTPSYSVEAPLAFAEDAKIVYKDSTDGWNEDIKDLQLSDDAYVEMTANAESRVPIYLDVKADPVDENGKVISAAKLKVEIPNGINASQDGITPVTSPVSIKITQLEDDALQLLDGLRFTITGAASKDGQPSVTGKTLNARDHTLKLTDIKVKIKGKVIGDFN